MKKHSFARLLALFLAVLMGLSAFSFSTLAADKDAGGDGDSSDSSDTGYTGSKTYEEIQALLNTISYASYLKEHADIASATTTTRFNAAEHYDEEKSTAQVSVVTELGGRTGKFLRTGEDGKVTLVVEVPATGMYSIHLTYYPEGNKATSIERMLYIDGKMPFSEARYLTMTKAWVDQYAEEFGKFQTDANGNDIRPTKGQEPEWRSYTLCDSTGYYVDEFSFYLTEGTHELTFESVREPLTLDALILAPVVKYPSYEDYLAGHRANGASEVKNGILKIDAEKPTKTSEQIIYPIYDRTSAITDPQDPSIIKLNTIGSSKWQTVGQWIRYDGITVSQSGFYQIAMRYKQSLLSGMYTSRRIRINGEIPFEEANYLQFNYSDNWQSAALNDGTNTFMFYFEAGKTYSIEFEVVLGQMSEVLREVSDILNELNSDYLKILMITGASPDTYRTYNFFTIIPETIKNLRTQRDRLNAIAERLYEITGTRGSHVATLNKVANLVERMSSKESEVAPNLTNLKSYLGTLGTWLYTSQQQSLEVDYFTIQGVDEKLPKAEAGFFRAAWFEIQQFAKSFTTDYNSIGSTAEEDLANDAVTVEIWFTGGRDRAQILRQLIDNEFTPQTKELFGHTINVELKLVAGGLLQSVLAGIGPDVSFLGSADTINWAIRDALIPLDQFSDTNPDYNYEDVVKWFNEAAMTPLKLNLGNGEKPLTYGLPSTQSFSMMFYRMDVFAELGLSVPRTWDEFYSILPILQTNNMTVAFPTYEGGLQMLLYQMGGTMYPSQDTDGRRINLDSKEALTAFDTLMSMFEEYRFPLTYDFATRFRTGEMPIGICSYETYNNLIVYASELRGLWEFAPLPGYEKVDADGNTYIDNVSVASTSAIVMPRGVEESTKQDAWRLMCWFVSEKAQSHYGSELQALMGSAAKYSTANEAALAEMPWSTSEYRALAAQMKNLVGIPEYPGSYIISRYVKFAFLAVYNQDATSTGENAEEALLDVIIDINKEISRKRKEFHLEYYEY